MSSNCCFKGRFKIISPYNRQNERKQKYLGMELAGISSIRVYSACDGEVQKIGYEPNGLGKYLIIKDTNGDRHIIGHFSSINVKEGERVYKQQSPLGIEGTTGKVTTKCVYYEIQTGSEFDPYNKDVSTFLEIPNKMGIYDSEECGINDLILPNTVETVENSVDNSANSRYFPACDKSFDVLENGLFSVGADTSQKYIYKLAYVNGIDGFRGQTRNKEILLEKLKRGKLIKA